VKDESTRHKSAIVGAVRRGQMLKYLDYTDRIVGLGVPSKVQQYVLAAAGSSGFHALSGCKAVHFGDAGSGALLIRSLATGGLDLQLRACRTRHPQSEVLQGAIRPMGSQW
jgi:hypothetical protein